MGKGVFEGESWGVLGFWVFFFERTIARLVEAVLHVPVRGVDRDSVPEVLQRDGRVDDQPLCAADAEVWVEEDDASLCLGFSVMPNL